VTGDEFPRQVARTRNFSLGVPRSFTVAPDGSRVAFLRSRAGADAVTCLWVLDVEAGRERLVVDPRSLSDLEDEASLSDAERARRERVREQAGGVVTYACDRTVGRAVFSLGGRLFLAELDGGEVRELDAPGPVDDPRLDPSGSRIAYVTEGALHALVIDGVAGSVGSAMYQTRTGRSSTLVAAILVPSGDQQWPRSRCISSAATNSGSPQYTSGSSSTASTRSTPSITSACSAPSVT
jgi:dipeptidyl aminopeptidase/acylaminoacyl peptidase